MTLVLVIVVGVVIGLVVTWFMRSRSARDASTVRPRIEAALASVLQPDEATQLVVRTNTAGRGSRIYVVLTTDRVLLLDKQFALQSGHAREAVVLATKGRYVDIQAGGSLVGRFDTIWTDKAGLRLLREHLDRSPAGPAWPTSPLSGPRGGGVQEDEPVARRAAADALRTAVSDHGPEALADPQRLRALLADTLGARARECRTEVELLIAAATAGSPTRSIQVGLDPRARADEVGTLVSRGLAEEDASWAVRTWEATLITLGGPAATSHPTKQTASGAGLEAGATLAPAEGRLAPDPSVRRLEPLVGIVGALVLAGLAVVFLGGSDGEPADPVGASEEDRQPATDTQPDSPSEPREGITEQDEPSATVVSHVSQRIASADHQTCAIRGDGTVACWGHPDLSTPITSEDPRSQPPAGTFAALAAGWLHHCGIRIDGTVACWGLDNFGQASPPDDRFLVISAGGHHTCAIRDEGPRGSVVCWGSGEFGEASPPDGRFAALAAGNDHTCAFPMSCWGSNASGESSPPEPVGTLGALQRSADATGATVENSAGRISSGGAHTCFVRGDSSLECWGLDDDGQASPPSGAFTMVSANGFRTCALTVAGDALCWGYKGSDSTTPPAAGPFVAIAAHYRDTCAIRVDGTLACWGHADLHAPEGQFT